MEYRREIDGLRAVAVVPVVLFHSGISLFSGGFVGVDVFLVISGYLITAMILQERARGTFSLTRFYGRRAWRLVPALLVMLSVSFLLACAWMPPSQMESFSRALAASALFISNILFWRESGYFDLESQTNPLLHTWSLSLEVQFYILFPVVLLLGLRFGKSKVFWLILVTSLLSLALTEYGWRYKAWANFYLLPTRLWEFCAGSLCALWLSNRAQKGNNILAFAGLIGVVVSFFLFDKDTPFPSLWALLPVIGTVLLILFGSKDTVTGRMLAMKPLVGIGLISYSIYLWHQPLLAFLRIRSIDEPSTLALLLAALACFPIAYLSWRFVEQPFRKAKSEKGAVRLVSRGLVTGVSVCAGIVFVAAAGVATDGYRFRFDPELVAIDDARTDVASLISDCYMEPPAGGGMTLGPMPRPACTFPASDGSVEVAIVGDSHALTFSNKVIDALKQQDVGVTTMSFAACVPFEGYWHSRAKCNEPVAELVEYILASDIKTVVLAGRYALYTRDDPFDNGVGGVEPEHMGPKYFTDPLYEGDYDDTLVPNMLHVMEKGIRKYLDGGKNLVLLYPVPESGWSVPDRYFKERLYKTGVEDLSFPYAAFKERNGDVISFFDSLDDPGLKKVRPADVLCSKEEGRCLNAVGSTVYYYDDDHLSNAGASLLVEPIVQPVLATLAPQKQIEDGLLLAAGPQNNSVFFWSIRLTRIYDDEIGVQ